MTKVCRVLLAVLGLAALTAGARAAGDRAAFEKDMADFVEYHDSLKGLSPEPQGCLSNLVGIGEAYCRMKQARGGGPLDTAEAGTALEQSNPSLARFAHSSTDNVAATNVAMAEANKLLCP